MPEWQADFSHVLTLNLSGRALLAQETTALLQRFPNVQHLQLYVRPEHLGAVTERLASAPGITQLSFTGPSLTYSAQALRPLGRMAGLRQLSLAGNLQTLDVSGLTALRRLTVSGTLETWPQGILELEHLEFLDITQTQLRSVPDEMFTGHQRLWRGLQMNWSAYEPQEFMKVYEHLHDNPAHLVEEQRLVQGYCEGVLGGLQPGAAAFIERVLAHFSARGLTPASVWRRLTACARNTTGWSMSWSNGQIVTPALAGLRSSGRSLPKHCLIAGAKAWSRALSMMARCRLRQRYWTCQMPT